MRRHVLERYHFYLNHRGGNRLAKIVQEDCYWIRLVTQAGFVISHSRYVNSSKRGILSVDIYHLRKLHN